MEFKVPKNDAKYHWTNHVVNKMMYYGLSPSRVLRVIRAPKRAEEGVAENTVAVMQPVGSPKRPQEIWVMYQERGREAKTAKEQLLMTRKKIIITAWRYPGVSRVRDKVPLPEGLMAELERENLV